MTPRSTLEDGIRIAPYCGEPCPEANSCVGRDKFCLGVAVGRRKKNEDTQEIRASRIENLEPESDDVAVDEPEETDTISVRGKSESEDETPREPTAEEAVEETEEVEAPKPKRRRRQTRKKPALVLTGEAVETIMPEIDLSTDNLKSDRNLEAITKQWILIRDISQSITNHLERVATVAKELPAQMTPVQKPQPSFVSKIAAGLSALALILSIVSLSLSQSARREALTHQMASVAPIDHSLAARPETEPLRPKRPSGNRRR